MNWPAVSQAVALSRIFAETLEQIRPRSIALVGCAGGNGLEHIDREQTPRVIGIDINADYLATCGERFPWVETLQADIEQPLAIEAVELVHVALVLEFVRDPRAALQRLRELADQVSVVLQLESVATAAITPSPFGAALGALGQIHRLLRPEDLELEPAVGRYIDVPGGKRFWHAIIR